MERLAEQIDQLLCEQLSVTSHVFIDPTHHTAGSADPLLPDPARRSP